MDAPPAADLPRKGIDHGSLVDGLGAAVRWLLDSGVRTADGGLRSVYRPASDTYVTYGGGLSCLQCTAGGVMALLSAARVPRGEGPGSARCLDAALESAEHILGLVLAEPASRQGALPCGLQAASVKTLHTEAALRALLAVHEVSGDGKWLKAAHGVAKWCAGNLQRFDGSFRSGADFTRYGQLRRALADVSPIGAAAYVRTLRRIARACSDPDLEASASRLLSWLRRQQDGEGGFPMYRYRPLTRPIAPFFHSGASEIWSGCLRYHPSPNVWMIEALLSDEDEDGARRVSRWFMPRFGPNGLLYQYYFHQEAGDSARGRGPGGAGGIVPAPYGAHSVEEDVMPTASLALRWMERPSVVPDDRFDEMLARIASGVLYAQIRDGRNRTEGGVRGLPLHPRFGGDVYTWDTAYAVLYLAAYLESGSGGRAPA